MSHPGWLSWLTGGRNPPGTTSSQDSLPAAETDRQAELAARLKHYLSEVLESGMGRTWHCKFNPWAVASGEAMIKAAPDEQAEIVVAIQELRGSLSTELGWDTRNAISALKDILLRKPLPFTAAQTVVLAQSFKQNLDRHKGPDSQLIASLEAFAKQQPLSEEAVGYLRAALQAYTSTVPLATADARRSVHRLNALVRGEPIVFIIAGEAWSDAVLKWLKETSGASRQSWMALFEHCQDSETSTPSAKWLKTARKLMDAVGTDTLRGQLAAWLPLIDETKPEKDADYFSKKLEIEPNLDLLKGLVWCCGCLDDVHLARSVGAAAASFYKKVPNIGPRSIKIGNACIYALSAMPGTLGLAQLSFLKVKIKLGTAQQAIEKALRAVATRLGMPRDEIEELAVPTYAMDEVGVRREVVGGYTAELTAKHDGATTLAWSKEGGKLQKSVPAVVKQEFAEELKELKAAAKENQKMLPAQKERIDGLFLAQKRWPTKVWRERYLDHPLVGLLARRLIWDVVSDESRQAVCWHEGRLVDQRDRPITVDESAAVELWHPIGRSVEEVVAWREWLEQHEIQQPLKQAHREVYLLTDAERRTETYSNRFAAHLLRQHQFNALCGQRAWKNKLRLMVDDAYAAPSRPLPLWGLRAEFWVESAGTEFGIDTNEAGTYLYLTTDQVRFYRIDAAGMHAHASGRGYASGWGRDEAPEPLRLELIPPLVFSEIMRDVDLFVGVASVGNDPNWADGGPEGRHADYWQRYSFGELSASAQTRKEVLMRIVPRLKIAERCSFVDKFLVVRGDLRTYKIHLGSGNILMAPNDQYLCIVPDRRMPSGSEKVFLPFAGDGTLSIILSKALLLAEDKKITDATITRQILAAATMPQR